MADVYEYRYTRHKIAEIADGRVKNPSDAATIFRKEMAGTEQESLWVMALDPSLKVIGVNQISIGTGTSVPAEPKAIFRYAVRVNADKIVVAHYHYVEDTTPSQADKVNSAQLVEAGDLLGIEVLDCQIVTDNDWCSILQVMTTEVFHKMVSDPDSMAAKLSKMLGEPISADSIRSMVGKEKLPN